MCHIQKNMCVLIEHVFRFLFLKWIIIAIDRCFSSLQYNINITKKKKYPQFCQIQNISGAKQPMKYLSMYMSVHFQIEFIYSAFSKKHQALNLIKIASRI